MMCSLALLVLIGVSAVSCRQLGDPRGAAENDLMNSDYDRQYDYYYPGSEGTTKAPTTKAPTTKAPTTKAPTTKAPTTKPPGSGACQCGVANPTRIVGGTEVSPAHKYPWQVGLGKQGYYGYSCGGAIINNLYVLTAAHCFFDKEGNRLSDEGLVVGVGDHIMTSSNDDVAGVTKEVPVAKVILHESYNPKAYDYDIALLRLGQTLDLASHSQVRAVCLPDDDSKTYVGENAIASGWGALGFGDSQPDALREVMLPILSTCLDNTGITERMLCAGYEEGGKDTCQGDSGGPLCVKEGSKFVQVGVVSFGDGCAQARKPGVYARVTKFLTWIKEKTSDATYC
ncbi:putative trypsin-1-like [Penaeus vannamei]|uniref:limulus clotting factor C n=1 Tax=Penaeus vannamei TaxID=6689 RepID=A0A423T4Y3_PENVA|nr:serine proteinase stubble-like [Penaeus vannamei]ROT71560.1 putative trypsin-1-like [Penaeus vannamei]